MKKSHLIVLTAVLAVSALWTGMKVRLHQQVADFAAPAANHGNTIAQLLSTSLKTPENEPKSLNFWQGKVLVVNFWATWCPPCREEMPEFSRAQERFAGNGVQFVGIAIDEAAAVVRFANTLSVSYPLLVGTPEVLGLTAALGNPQQALPYTLIIGRDGKQVASHLGRLTEADLIAQLSALKKP